MTESKKAKILKRRRPFLTQFAEINRIEKIPRPKRTFRFRRPTSVIQKIKPSKRITRDAEFNSVIDSEEINSDEYIDNEDDWYDDLDVVAKPHLLGPSATYYSPVPIEYQHHSNFPFSCQQILIECRNNEPVASYVPWNYPQSFHHF